MDNQELKLRKQLEGTGVSVNRIGDNITLNMPGNITFPVDGADINSGFYNILDSVALVLNEFNQTFVEVAGHTEVAPFVWTAKPDSISGFQPFV